MPVLLLYYKKNKNTGHHLAITIWPAAMQEAIIQIKNKRHFYPLLE